MALWRNNLAKLSTKIASYQVLSADVGTIFTNRGASGAVTFTLPAVADLPTGWWCEFFVAANQSFVIASYGSADNITTFNDLTADSITINTSAERIGFGSTFVWDGTGWLAFNHLGAETQTPTIA